MFNISQEGLVVSHQWSVVSGFRRLKREERQAEERQADELKKHVSSPVKWLKKIDFEKQTP